MGVGKQQMVMGYICGAIIHDPLSKKNVHCVYTKDLYGIGYTTYVGFKFCEASWGLVRTEPVPIGVLTGFKSEFSIPGDFIAFLS